MTDPKADAVPAEEETPSPGAGESSGEAGGEELKKLAAELDERTNDLKRVTAEYANYRKRVDRDRKLVADQATISVVTGLLPVLDDLDRARTHGDLTGPFASVAEQLTGALSRLGLAGFGEKGDAFDPNRHEAVAHMLSPEVTEPTCIDVMRRGYELGDRLVRPALVAVADPAPAEAKTVDEAADTADAAASEEPKAAEDKPAEGESKEEPEAPAADAEAAGEDAAEVKDEAAEAEPAAEEAKPAEKRKPSPHPKPKAPAEDDGAKGEAETETGSGEEK
ncbi:molecular chaperone GrpE (heat shock protein) [Phytomonospora endophytica]|uniref:Protein GrpE n=1 Tax=Phytomonospora endophytica TaxID=714109 RepID=A0A841FM21_9ACTN|nr:nucleotide exchange factor GrpE [Phytomonospora endophytica]MBB6035963.1 molecular chaperone GrpE (heat shock protein) [Phytomonospora endophytica]GIG66869.1 hypothetical protein Pen01_31640 [Phytomonospora endophytica]